MKTRFMNSFKTKIVLFLCFTLRHMIVESFTCGISSNCFGFIQKISTQKCWVTIGKHFDTFNNVNSQEIIYKYHRDVFQNNVWYAVGLTRLPSLPGRGSVVLGRGGRTGEGQGNEWWPQDCVQGQLWQFGEELDGFVYFIWSRASWENTVCLR